MARVLPVPPDSVAQPASRRIDNPRKPMANLNIARSFQMEAHAGYEVAPYPGVTGALRVRNEQAGHCAFVMSP